MGLIHNIRLAIDRRWPLHGTGRWRDAGPLDTPCADSGRLLLCDRCGTGYGGHAFKFCPECGARMETVQPVGNSEQLPRVLTKREAYEWMKEGKPYFMEVNRDDTAVWLTPVNYGRSWRCWTSRPKVKQREGTPWVNG